MSNPVGGSLSSVTLYTGAVILVPRENCLDILCSNLEVEEDPASAKAHRVFGEVLRDKGRVPQAAAEEYLTAGKLYNQKSQYADAYRCYKDANKCCEDFLEPIVQLAYLCRTLGYRNEAIHYFSFAGYFSKSSNSFMEAIGYFEEGLVLVPVSDSLMTAHLSYLKAECIFHSSFPLDKNERVKKAVAVLHPLLDQLEAKEKAELFYRVGVFYLEINPILAKKNFLDCICYSLKDYDVRLEHCDLLEFAYKAFEKLKSVDNSKTIETIGKFLQFAEQRRMEEDNIEEMVKSCDAMLRLCELPRILEIKAFLLSAQDRGVVSAREIDWSDRSENNVDVHTYNQFLRLLPNDHCVRSRSFSAQSTGEAGHPNENGLLEDIIKEAINKKISWAQFHSYVYSELIKRKKFNYTYYFRYKVRRITQSISGSDHLLFFSIFNLDIRAFQMMLEACNKPLMKIRDSKGNTLIHVAACFGLHQHVKALMMKANATGELSALINSRNQHGTNPLGMLFLDETLAHEKIVKVAQLFIGEPTFQINSYLNNAKGMDYRRAGYLKHIGGVTCLHMALKRELDIVLQLLQQRNERLPSFSDALVNMAFPSLNPDHHMNSPDKFISSTATKKAVLKQFLAERKAESEQADLDDSSGDSDDEEAPAFQHKKVLQDLASLVMQETELGSSPQLARLNRTLDNNEQISLEEQEQLEKEQEKVAVVHFHGVPFMKGNYTNFQRRVVGKKVQEINKTLIQPPVVKDDKLERLKAIHSRTSTTTAGMQTLYDVMTASDKQLEELEGIDEQLRTLLARVWMNKPREFIGSLKEYVYNFSQNPMESFWQNFPRSISDIIKYRFPICSLSKAPDHALKFAAGENVETQSLGEENLDPIYHEGKPRHRLAGLLYVTLHAVSDIHQLQNSCALADLAQLRCSGQMSTSQSRTDHQLEVSFFGGISGKDVKIIIPIIYPNLSKEFKKGYHDVIWGLGPVDFRTKRFDFDMLKHSFTNFALKIVQTLVDREGRAVCYIDETNKLRSFPTDLKSRKKDLSPAQLEIRQGTVTYSGVTKDQLTETTPEELNQSTASKQLSSSSFLKRETEARSKKRIDFLNQ